MNLVKLGSQRLEALAYKMKINLTISIFAIIVATLVSCSPVEKNEKWGIIGQTVKDRKGNIVAIGSSRICNDDIRGPVVMTIINDNNKILGMGSVGNKSIKDSIFSVMHKSKTYDLTSSTLVILGPQKDSLVFYKLPEGNIWKFVEDKILEANNIDSPNGLQP